MTGKEIEGYLVRTSSDGAVEFRIADAVVRAISIEVMRGFGVTRRRGAEVGGLLIGSVRKGSIAVEDCEMAPCEYAYGPSYLLSDNDAPKFAEAVMRWRPGPGIEKYAVGWFRSHTREGLQPDAPDLELFHRHFPGPASALLLIKPYATRASDAAVFLPYGGRLTAEPAIEFALAPSAAPPPVEPPRTPRLAPAPEPVAVADPEPLAEPEPEPLPAPAPPPPPQPIILPRIPTERERLLEDVLGPLDKTAEPTRRGVVTDHELFSDYTRPRERSWWRLVAWTVFVASAVLFGYALGYRDAGGNLVALMPWSAPVPVKDVYALGLSGRARGDSILVQWDRYSPAVQNAQRGLAVITSANGRDEIQLSGAELKSGVLLYKTDVAEADIRLEVFVTPARLLAEQTVWKRGAPVEQ